MTYTYISYIYPRIYTFMHIYVHDIRSHCGSRQFSLSSKPEVGRVVAETRPDEVENSITSMQSRDDYPHLCHISPQARTVLMPFLMSPSPHPTVLPPQQEAQNSVAIKSREVDDSEGTFTCPAQAGANEGGCAEVALRTQNPQMIIAVATKRLSCR